jgi:Tfp pilus assembly protein FimT
MADARGARMGDRKGFTLTELMAVVFLAILIMAIAFPKLKETRRAASMQSARTQVRAYLVVGRGVAIRTGVRSFVIRNGNTLTVKADSATSLVTVVQPVQLDAVSNVTLDATKDTVIYDARGVATNLANGAKFYITVASGVGAGTTDSICVTRLGLVLDRNCGAP